MKTAALFCIALLLTACAGKAPESKEPIKQFAMRGEVIQLDPEHQVATIKHEDIEGFMHAMTMEYGFRDKQEFAKLHKGDTFSATLFVQGDDYWVGQVKPAAANPAPADKPK
jgi:Cu/Ag efflux protein CusF